ncbi:flagellar biosynthesis protein FlhB (plasmid) [Pseudomonas silesiensis]|uniref:flagellar biosynthesis protein FlhB n=1 Tax=Pseudomonas silesiensis TaxID=1853130 RepID=UPI0030D44119
MSEVSQEDKTESATPQRLEKAREEGQIARSRELTTFVMLLGGIGALWGAGGNAKEQLSLLMEQAMQFDRERAFDTALALKHLYLQGQLALKAVAPIMGIMVVLALIAPALLGGWNFSVKSLQPNFGKLNPIAGIKKMFSFQTLNELGKAIAKSVLVGTVAVFFLKWHMMEIMALSQMTLEHGLASMLHLILAGCGYMAFSLIIVVAMDVPYQLISMAIKMRMTKEEIKQEFKENEGDPHIKGKIRAQQQAIARSRMMSKVPTADVIVTNPTHFAVALSYKDGDTGAPKVIAKGTDHIAARIRELGKEGNIPLLEAPMLARALYWNVDLDREIPSGLYTAVAEVLAWVYRLKQVKKEGGAAPETPVYLPVPEGMDARPTGSKIKRK